MKLRKGKHTYTLPKAIGQVLHTLIDESKKGGHRFVVQQINWEDMKENRDKKLRGRPSQMTFWDSKQITVWPTPDASYELVIRYYPPAEEM
jgi:hypothetical protein